MRLALHLLREPDIFVSIHASVKDATHAKNDKKDELCFNPRICKRCDTSASLAGTPSHCFNPRICKRCDVISCRIKPLLKVSIHASVKDATASSFYNIDSGLVSIHASVKDATFAMLMLISVILFQSTHL